MMSDGFPGLLRGGDGGDAGRKFSQALAMGLFEKNQSEPMCHGKK